MAEIALLHGLIDNEWQKSPLPFGASDTVGRDVNTSSAPSANYTVSDTPVPAGEVWVITNLSTIILGTAPAILRAWVVLNGVDTVIFGLTPPVVSTYYDRQGWWVMFPGDYLKIEQIAGTIGNAFFLYGTGFLYETDR
jgi:hypothetical protein